MDNGDHCQPDHQDGGDDTAHELVAEPGRHHRSGDRQRHDRRADPDA